MDSSPPPTTAVMPSCITCLAAVAMAIRPEEHCRSSDMPGTLCGSPARRAHCRAVLEPWLPCCSAAPMTTSSTSAGSRPARPTAWAMAWPPSAWAWVSLKAPRYARPIGVRAVETMTAERMVVLPPLLGRPSAAAIRAVWTRTEAAGSARAGAAASHAEDLPHPVRVDHGAPRYLQHAAHEDHGAGAPQHLAPHLDQV